MKRPQIILIAGSSVCLLLCVAAGWFYADALSTAGKAREERDNENRKLENIYKSNPFPDEANTLQVQEDLRELSDWTGRMHAVCVSNNLQTNAEINNPISLLQHIQKSVPELLAHVNAGGRRRVADNFSFSFERYLPPNPTMPEKEHVERLVRQYAMMDFLVRRVMASDIQQLNEFTREAFEDGRSAPTPNTPSKPGADESRIASREHFTLRFTARQDALDTVLNELAATPAFVRVTSVRAAKAAPSDLVMPTPELKAQVKPEDTVVKPGERLFPVEVLRHMSGPGISSMLDISMEMDILTFFPTLK